VPQLDGIAPVAVTGYAQPEDVELAQKAGFIAHLAKPPSVEAIERVLAAADVPERRRVR
jgi:CheY-like chemotaxis protein